jgi:hypothetical protein
VRPKSETLDHQHVLEGPPLGGQDCHGQPTCVPAGLRMRQIPPDGAGLRSVPCPGCSRVGSSSRLRPCGHVAAPPDAPPPRPASDPPRPTPPGSTPGSVRCVRVERVDRLSVELTRLAQPPVLLASFYKLWHPLHLWPPSFRFGVVSRNSSPYLRSEVTSISN